MRLTPASASHSGQVSMAESLRKTSYVGIDSEQVSMLSSTAAIIIQIIPPINLTKSARERQLVLAHISIPFHHAFAHLDPWSGRHFIGVTGPA